MSGHWSEKARNEAQLFGEVAEVAVDPEGFGVDIGHRCFLVFQVNHDGFYNGMIMMFYDVLCCVLYFQFFFNFWDNIESTS